MRGEDNLTHENWLEFAQGNYDNPTCVSTTEFLEDMKHLKYLKKLITQYEQGGELKIRLILNHVTLLLNVLGPRALPRILFLKFPTSLAVIKPLLIMLYALPPMVRNIGREGQAYDTEIIAMDPAVVGALRRL